MNGIKRPKCRWLEGRSAFKNSVVDSDQRDTRENLLGAPPKRRWPAGPPDRTQDFHPGQSARNVLVPSSKKLEKRLRLGLSRNELYERR